MKSKITLILVTLLFTAKCLFLSSCGSNSEKKISISGAFALYPMAIKWAEEFKKTHPDVKIDISAGGAGKGMADALSGTVDLGMVSRGINPEETAKGAYPIAVTKDAVIPTINEKNPVLKDLQIKGVTKAEFADIFITGKLTEWGKVSATNSSVKINAFTRSDACGAAEMWGKYLGKNQEGLLGVGVFGDPGMADAVRANPSAIGFNNVIYVYDIKSRKTFPGLAVVPIDVNENGKIDADEMIYNDLDQLMKAIQDGKYPSPPARDLYFVSKGKSTNPAVKEFLNWILTEGQKFVKEAGYVELAPEKIKGEIAKL